MSPIELAKKLSFNIANEGCGNEKKISGIYCCDLLSLVMGRAKENDAWITVMCNINTLAVATLADTSCIIISEDLHLDEQIMEKAMQQNICILESKLPTFETAYKIAKEIGFTYED